jgi:hypothetical protein
VAGTTVFTNLNKDFNFGARLTVAVVSVLIALLTAAQTFLNYGKRAEACRSVSSQFGNIRREIDILEKFPPSSPQEMEVKLRELNGLITKISSDAPLIDAPRKNVGWGGSGGGSDIMIRER